MTKFVCSSGYTVAAYSKPCQHCGATKKEPCRKAPRLSTDERTGRARTHVAGKKVSTP